MCHFELKPSSGKVMSNPPCIELASCIQYICKKFENVHLFSEIFSIFLSCMKIEHVYPIGYISKILKISTAFLCFFEKNLPLHQPYHRLGTVFGHFKLKSNPPQGGLHSPTTEVISKTSPCCVATFGKNSKNLLHTTDYQDYPPVL